ncbi:MAG TPA: kynureninase [Candidatus Saccharimonadales bacterium]|nr:kynureninase [Candidatus Saccharimonadales bacterium]
MALDARDPLAAFRDRFLNDGATIYLDGNSMGRLPKAAVSRLREMAEHEWGTILVRGWTEAGWMESPLRVGDRVAELIGASPGEVLVADTTSVGLFRLMTSVLRARPERRVIVTERSNFPTDLYIASGVAELLGGEVRAVERADLRDSLDGETALLMLTEVDFRTGERHDMGAFTRAAHAAGALVLWDLSHSAGAVEIQLNRHHVDLAVGCGYKYLNGGPGSPAYLYVATALQEELRNPIQGWLGHDNPFLFDAEYRRASGMRGWMSGSPPVLAIGTLAVGIDMQLEAGARAVGEKAALLTEIFMRLAHARLDVLGFEVATPGSPERRGAQVSLRHSDGLAMMRALADRGVIGDFRPPDLCRFGLAPLYTRFVDLWDAVERIADVVESGANRLPKYREDVAIP